MAETITAISGKGCEKNPEIISLWHEVAKTVADFSEHPTKKVATLIIDDKGNLEAFGVNRVPAGIPKRSKYYTEGQRKDFIVCSERIALARLLNVRVRLPKLNHIRKRERYPHHACGRRFNPHSHRYRAQQHRFEKKLYTRVQTQFNQK